MSNWACVKRASTTRIAVDEKIAITKRFGAEILPLFDDGTLAPTAALGSLAFAPEIVVPAANAMKRWPKLYGKYGFLDSFNPSFRYTDVKLETGSVDPKSGWVARDYLGIDQGAIDGAIANTRDEGVWRVMRRSPAIRRGLQRAGFTGGWLG